MEQVLHLLYLNHRTTLAYPENNMLPLHPHRPVLQPTPRRALEEEYGSMRRVNQSLDLGPSRSRAISESRGSSSRRTHRRVSQQEAATVQKYLKKYEPPEETKDYISLPKIPKNLRAREEERRKIEVKRPTTAQRRKMAQRVKRKMKRWVLAIMFIRRLQRKLMLKVNNFNLLTDLSESLVEIMKKMIDKYYCNILEIPLMGYGDNLRLKISDPSKDITENVVYNILDISEGLKKSSIRKDILKFLTLVTMNHARVPHDFFTQFELLRLEFSPRRFELVQMVKLRVRMVVGFFLAVKMFCGYIINHPWDVPILQVTWFDAKKMEPVIWAYSSYFYYATKSFFQKLPAQSKSHVKALKAKGVEVVAIKQESDYFYDGVNLNYAEVSEKIHKNLAVWINRVSEEVIKNRKNLEQH